MPKKKKSGSSSRKDFFWSEVLQGNKSAFAGLVITQRDERKETIWQAIAQTSSLSPDAHCFVETQFKKSANNLDKLNSKLQGKDYSALGLAITMDNYEGALFLLDMGADIHTAFADDSLWLHRMLGCMAKADEILEMLQILSERAVISELCNQQDSDQCCVYEYALVKHKSDDLCEKFLRMGLAPSFLIQGQPLVLWLVANGKQDLLEVFLPHLSKEQVYASDKKGGDILFKACAEGDINLVRTLLRIHPHPRYVGECKQNALHVLANIAKDSVSAGHKEVFDLLLQIGIDCSHVNDRGNTPLMEMIVNESHQEWINQLILVSNLYQVNHDNEHCLNMAIRKGLADVALVILRVTRSMVRGPFVLESKVCPLPGSFIKSLDSKLKKMRIKRLLSKLPESASPASVALMSHLLYDSKITKVIRELICFRGHELEWNDDPYQALLSVGSFRLVGVLLKHGVPIKKNKTLIDQCMENVSPNYPLLINGVNKEITAGRMGEALEIAKKIPLELFPITWACYPDFLEYILLSFLEYHYLQFSFETLYQIIKRDKLSQYLELDNYYDHACNSVGINFVPEFRNFLARLEQKKINERCSEGSKRQLKRMGFVLTPGEMLPILEPSESDHRKYRELIHYYDVRTSTGYRNAKEYWTRTLSTDLGDCSELKSEGLSFVQLFFRRFEYDHFEKKLNATLKYPQGMLTAFSVLASSSNPELRKGAMIAVNKQIANNISQERGGFLASLLGSGRGSSIADEDFMVDKVLSDMLSGDEILGIATKVLNSLRINNGERSVTGKSQEFFEVIAKTILSPRGMLQGAGLLATWLDACEEQAVWLQSPEVRIQILHYVSVRYKNNADGVIEVLERILQYIGHEVFDIPMNAVGSVESSLAARAEESVQSHQGDQRDYVLDRSEIILFLCQSEILQLVKKGNQQLYLRLQTYTACEVIACNRRSMWVRSGKGRALEDARKSTEIASLKEKAQELVQDLSNKYKEIQENKEEIDRLDAVKEEKEDQLVRMTEREQEKDRLLEASLAETKRVTEALRNSEKEAYEKVVENESLAKRSARLQEKVQKLEERERETKIQQEHLQSENKKFQESMKRLERAVSQKDTEQIKIQAESRKLQEVVKGLERTVRKKDADQNKLQLENRRLQAEKKLGGKGSNSDALESKVREENRRLQAEKEKLEEQGSERESLGNKLREENIRLQADKKKLEEQGSEREVNQKQMQSENERLQERVIELEGKLGGLESKKMASSKAKDLSKESKKNQAEENYLKEENAGGNAVQAKKRSQVEAVVQQLEDQIIELGMTLSKVEKTLESMGKQGDLSRLEAEKADLDQRIRSLNVSLSEQEKNREEKPHESRLSREGRQRWAVDASNDSAGALGMFAPSSNRDGGSIQGSVVHPRHHRESIMAYASGRTGRFVGSEDDVDGRGYAVSQSDSSCYFAHVEPQGAHYIQQMWADQATQGSTANVQMWASQVNQGSMSRVLGWSRRIASMLHSFDPSAGVYLGGSLALSLARSHKQQQTLWVQAADMGSEDIDMSIVTRHSVESIQKMLESGFSRAREDSIIVSLDRKCGSMQVNITGNMIYRVEIRINPHYIPYPDAINWAWSQCLGYHEYSDWVFDISKIYWYQYQFIYSDAWRAEVPNGCQYSFFWGVFQLIKHRHYMGDYQLQACHSGMMSGYRKIQSKMEQVANAVLEIIKVFSGTLFWKSCLQVLLGYEVEKSVNGMPYVLIYSLLPKDAIANGICIDGTEDLASIKTEDKLLEWIKDRYTKRCGAGLLEHKGPVVWADVAGKDVEPEVTSGRKGERSSGV